MVLRSIVARKIETIELILHKNVYGIVLYLLSYVCSHSVYVGLWVCILFFISKWLVFISAECRVINLRFSSPKHLDRCKEIRLYQGSDN